MLPQLKHGDLRAGAEASLSLCSAGRPLEARHFGFAVLQHLVHARWAEFSEAERTQMARVALDRLHEGTARLMRQTLSAYSFCAAASR